MHIKLLDLINDKNFNINFDKNLCTVPTLYCDCDCDKNKKNKYKYTLRKSDKDHIDSKIFTNLIDKLKPNKKHTRRQKKKTRSTKKLKN
tara:strand:+ start:128 stop:394 length:267 start_codon:yes stop_codon:yes gene_type:complete